MTGTPVRILLARHGETVFNVERRYQGQSDSPLTERGVEQARELAWMLRDERVGAVYTSDLGRALETALVVAVPHGLQVFADPRLREVDVGDWTGLSREELAASDGERMRAWDAQPSTVRLPRGEAIVDVQARALRFFEERMPMHAGQTVVVITHGAISQSIMVHGLGGSIGDLWLDSWLANCEVSRLQWHTDSGLSLLPELSPGARLMPLDLLETSTQVRQMGELLAQRRADDQRRLTLLDRMLEANRDRWPELAELAEQVRERVAVPTGPLDERIPAPERPTAYTALATDGAEIDPDRHGGSGDFFLINLGRVRIPYGQPGRAAELRSHTSLGFTDDDLFIVDPRDPRRQVPMRDRHLDALRTVEELRALANLAEEESGAAPAVALVDGTLLFSVLEERPRDFLRARFYSDFVSQLERLKRARVPVAAYASRSRGIDVVNLFRAVCGSTPLVCDVCGGAPSCALRGLTDAHLLGRGLEPWDRCGLFRVRSNIHDPFYGPHRVYFFLLHTADEIARVEVPEWVARDRELLELVHGVLVDQCAKGFGYPAVLARADDRAVISLSDRGVLDTLVRQELARRGVLAKPSAKLGRKQVRTV